jgi:hypothetical protein
MLRHAQCGGAQPYLLSQAGMIGWKIIAPALASDSHHGPKFIEKTPSRARLRGAAESLQSSGGRLDAVG